MVSPVFPEKHLIRNGPIFGGPISLPKVITVQFSVKTSSEVRSCAVREQLKQSVA